MADTAPQPAKVTRVPTAVVYGEYSPREFQNLGLNPVEGAMQEFVAEEKFAVSQTNSDDSIVVLFGSYCPKNSQSFRNRSDNLTGQKFAAELERELRYMESRDILMDMSVSVQYVPHVHGHYGKKREGKELSLEGGHYIGIDVFSIISGGVFSALKEDHLYGPATVLSRENGFHCNKRALSKHAPNGFIPYARVPDSTDLEPLKLRLNESGCKSIRDYARALYETENEQPPETELDEKEAFTDLAELTLNKNIKYNRICVACVH